MSRTGLALGVPLVTAAFFRLYDLTAVGEGNTYYAATVKSMTTSLAAFLYGSFDPQLYVSVDKPAPGLWPQAITAKLFGFSSLAILLPQAICGLLSVAVLFSIVRRAHGVLAAGLAALALAVAPVAVAVDRNNTMDAELVLVLLLAVWFALRAVETGPRALLAAGALVGLGFSIKMSQAYLAGPAIALTYLIASRSGVAARLIHVIAFAVVTVAVSAAWIAFVDLTPADARPYVGSSTNNTALELAIGHNGLERLPQEILFWRVPRGPAPQPLPPAPGPAQLGPVGEAGENGPLRLVNEQLAGQVSWYIPIALIGAVAIFVAGPRSPFFDRARSSGALWILWLIPAAILFSWSGIFHRYYLVMLAPPLAALTGAGITALIGLAGTSVVWRVVAALAAIVTAALQSSIVMRSDYAGWIVPVVIAGAAACAAAASGIRWRGLAPIAIAALFAAPIAWSATTLVAFDAGLPFAGPELLVRGRPGTPIGRPAPPRSPLLDFLLTAHRGERWIVATSSLQTAAQYMLRSDESAMALGGFSGGDPILTPRALEAKVRGGEVRFVLIEDRMRPELDAWVRSRCVPVPGPLIGAPPGGAPQPGGQGALFDCARVTSG